jgi:pilus assembly protein FimV
MPIAQALRSGLLASILLCVAASSAALTLGHSNGVPLIGRLLDVTIPVTLDGASQAGELCPEADVFMGESKVEAGRITVRVEPGTAGNVAVRVRTSRPVDEPVVTINLRLACTQQITRRYVLLSEQPGEIAAPVTGFTQAPAPVAAAPRAASGGQADSGSFPASRAPATASGRGGSVATRGRASRAADAQERVAAASSRGAAASRAERALPQRGSDRNRVTSRLKMDLLDAAPARDPQLRSSPELTTAPSTSEQVRAQAAALWRALNAQPEDLLRDLQRVQALENDLKGLRSMVAANDRTLLELRQELEQARQQRTLTLAVIALLLLLLSAGVVTWWLRRGERSGSETWWSGRGVAAPAVDAGAAGRIMDVDLQIDESMFKSLKESPPIYPPMRDKEPGKGPLAPAPTTAAAPIAAADRASSSGFHSGFHSSFQGSQAASMRMVKAEELVDIQQQADFFMSLGQADQAVAVLENHIRNNVETSALVWLDLLAIYRAIRRPADYEALRTEFHRVFNADVPAYDVTPTVSGGLEDYPRALTRIAALWPSAKVMDLIEESIFRRPGGDGEPFDLEAYRELVMLYNVGREVVQPDTDVPEGWSDAESETANQYETAMQPLSVARDGSQPPDVSLDSLQEVDESALLEPLDLTGLDQMLDPKTPRPSPRLGLDIDLSSEPPVAGPPAAVPDNSIDFELVDPDPGAKPQLEPDEQKGDEPDPKKQ